MTPFEELVYHQHDFDTLQQKIEVLLEEFNATESTAQLLSIFQQINQMQTDFRTAYHLAYVLSMRNLSDESHKEKLQYCQKNYAKFMRLLSRFHQLILKHPKRTEMEKKLGKQYFVRITQSSSANPSTSKSIASYIEKERQLKNEYRQKTSGQKIAYKGTEMSLSEVGKEAASMDRNIRREAINTLMDFRLKNAPELEEIFENLVKVRHEQAVGLGYNNFAERGYVLRQRQGYELKDIEYLNGLIRQYFTPLWTTIQAQKPKRLGLEKIEYWDKHLQFADGDPTVEGTISEVMAKFQRLFSGISTELGELFEAMNKNGYIDAEVRPNKYDIYQKITLPGYGVSFVLTQIEGNCRDIDFLVHEIGHAFQADKSKTTYQKIFEYLYASTDLGEIPSTSLEFLALPQYPIFFKGANLQKAYTLFFERVVTTLLRGSANEAFQQEIYENPHMGMEARNDYWRENQQKYFPTSNKDNSKSTHPYLQSGKNWLANKHIFLFPFYMIDYSLAYICAIQLWMRAETQGFEVAWKDYCLLCEKGGSISFLEALDLLNLKSPFEEETIREIAQFLEEQITSAELLNC